VHIVRILAAVSLATVGAVVVGAPAHAAGTSKVSVVHGIPNTPVDVYVNGRKTLDNFAPATVAGPLDLPEGSYDIALTKPGEPATSPLLEVKGAKVPADANLSLVAHLTADGKPTITPFVNDTAKLAAGKARLTARHTAAAPAVDVRAGGQPVFTNLANPNEAKADIDAGTVNADVVLAGTGTVALGPTDVTLGEGTSTIVYAIGSATDKTLAVVSQRIQGLHSAPAGGVPSGTGGLAATGASAWWYAAAALGLLLLGLGVTRIRRPAAARR
jgi:hypothetical protein